MREHTKKLYNFNNPNACPSKGGVSGLLGQSQYLGYQGKKTITPLLLQGFEGLNDF